MKYIFLILLAFIHLSAAVLNIKTGHIGSWVMIIGSFLILLGIYLGFTTDEIKWWHIIIGIILIIDSAIYNGSMQGQIHWTHHGIRLLIFVLALIPLIKSK